MRELTIEEMDEVTGGDRGDSAVAGAIAGATFGARVGVFGGVPGTLAGIALGAAMGAWAATAIYDFGMKPAAKPV